MPFVFDEPFTTSEAPAKRRRDTKPEHKHTADEWEERRARISKLFEDNELPEVAAIMASEGFDASIPQYRNRLKNWGHWKYLKLTQKQWQYIGRALLEREGTADEKKTAFKLNGRKIPSSKLEKELAVKFEEDDIDNTSAKSTISSCGVSVYTSSTASGVALRSRRKALEDMSFDFQNGQPALGTQSGPQSAAYAPQLTRRSSQSQLYAMSRYLSEMPDKPCEACHSYQYKLYEVEMKLKNLDLQLDEANLEIDHLKTENERLQNEMAAAFTTQRNIISVQEWKLKQLKGRGGKLPDEMEYENADRTTTSAHSPGQSIKQLRRTGDTRVGGNSGSIPEHLKNWFQDCGPRTDLTPPRAKPSRAATTATARAPFEQPQEEDLEVAVRKQLRNRKMDEMMWQNESNKVAKQLRSETRVITTTTNITSKIRPSMYQFACANPPATRAQAKSSERGPAAMALNAPGRSPEPAPILPTGRPVSGKYLSVQSSCIPHHAHNSVCSPSASTRTPSDPSLRGDTVSSMYGASSMTSDTPMSEDCSAGKPNAGDDNFLSLGDVLQDWIWDKS